MKKILSLLMLSMAFIVQSQILPKSDYVVLTFERTYDEIDETLIYHWIAPADTTEQFCERFFMYPLYNDAISQYDIDASIVGDTINWFRDYEGCDSSYMVEVNKFNDILKRHRTLIQTFQTKWHKYQQKETVKVYMTPITGVFSTCIQVYPFIDHWEKLGFKGRIYLPISDFSYYSKFHQTNICKTIEYALYSTFDFSSFIPYTHQYHFDRKRMEPLMDAGNDIRYREKRYFH